MKIRHLKFKISLIALLPLCLILRELAYRSTVLTESIYSRTIYPPIGIALSKISGVLPFSLGEILVYGIIIFCLFSIIRLIIRLVKSDYKLHIGLNWIMNAVCVLCLGYSLFLLLWGYNYYRQPLAFSIQYKIEKSSVEDLKNLCSHLIDKTNQLRSQVQENQEGVLRLPGDFKSTASRADVGYQNLSLDYPIFKGSYGKPKGVFASKQFCYLGIEGIYFPFTGEPNVNIMTPSFFLPSTICHEMAHQRGFAREDEANFIAYLACKAHQDADFQYSGYLLAAVYSMNQLYKYDPDSYKQLSAKYSPAVLRDLRYNAQFWKQFEGPAEELQERMNDAYLKSNKQADGIYSYGRMVDLLLAEYKSKKHP